MSLIEVVERAYGCEGPDSEWLKEIARTLGPHLGDALGTTAFRYVHRSPHAVTPVGEASYIGNDDGARRALEALPSVDRSLARTLFSGGYVCGSLSQLMGSRFSKDRAVAMHLHGNGICDATGVSIRDVTGAGLVIAAASDVAVTLTDDKRRALALVSAHIAAAERLRRKAGATLELAEAVLTPGGRVEHAVGIARSQLSRQALRIAAAAVDRARSRRHRTDRLAPLELWNALVAGRWSLVDHFDRDGRRFLIARRNDPEVGKRAALSLKARQAVGYASLGHANKLIAYHLGISTSAVAKRLASAGQKLRVRSRAELIQLWGRFERGGRQ